MFAASLSSVAAVSVEQRQKASMSEVPEMSDDGSDEAVETVAMRNASGGCPTGCSCSRREVVICTNYDTLTTIPTFADWTSAQAQMVTEL